MTANTSLFGCCGGDKSQLLMEYQEILTKILIEDKEAYEELYPALDINADFPIYSGLKMIVGTLVDMRSRYGTDVTYEALEMELMRKTSDEYIRAEVSEYLRVIREMSLDDTRVMMCREQFMYWKQFCILAKIANETCEMLREPWYQTDFKMTKMIEEVKALAEALEAPRKEGRKTNDW